MRLLIVTQSVDLGGPILAFFHGWIAEFAKRADRVTVIGQRVGKYNFPANVTLVSLQKERGRPRMLQVIAFWAQILLRRGDYDAVFVHMTPVWLVLGGPVWALLGKSRYLWYEARGGGWALPLALLFARKIFGASSYGLPRGSARHVITGHGIDTGVFAPGAGAQEEGLIVSVGRITPVKHFDIILRTVAELPEHFHLIIAGGTITARDEAELARLKELTQALNLRRRVAIAWVEPGEIPVLFRRAEMSLSACGGGLDKAVLEAMACGCPVVYCGNAAEGVLPAACIATPSSMLATVENILALSGEERETLCGDLRRRVEEGHSLPVLIERLVREMDN